MRPTKTISSRQHGDQGNAGNARAFVHARNRSFTGRAVLTPAADHQVIFETGLSRLRSGEGVSPNWSTRQQDPNRDYWSLMHNGHWGKLASVLSWLDEKTSR